MPWKVKVWEALALRGDGSPEGPGETRSRKGPVSAQDFELLLTIL